MYLTTKRTLLGDVGLRLLVLSVSYDDPTVRRRWPADAIGVAQINGVERVVVKDASGTVTLSNP